MVANRAVSLPLACEDGMDDDAVEIVATPSDAAVSVPTAVAGRVAAVVAAVAVETAECWRIVVWDLRR